MLSNPLISVVITTFNEGNNLDRLLVDISKQDVDIEILEILLLEAGSYPIERAMLHLGKINSRLKFISMPGLTRTAALNILIRNTKGRVIIRLDARSHIFPDYLMRIYQLSNSSGAANVGGVQVPIGLSTTQKVIASVMKSPFSLGGAKFRNLDYVGPADTVYLGAFNKEKIPFSTWFDEVHPKISEDSDLNYRLRKSGGSIFVDSSIQVEHFPRESLSKFYKLCFNYGIGRGLFICKHRQFSALRQIVPPLSLLLLIIFLIEGINYPLLHWIILIGLLIYFGTMTYVSFKIVKGYKEIVKAILGFSGCHFFWSIGVFFGFFIYVIDLYKISKKNNLEN